MDTTNTTASSGQFDWLAEAWFTGTADQRCQYCLRPILFVPTCLGIEVCTCNDTNVSTRGNPAPVVELIVATAREQQHSTTHEKNDPNPKGARRDVRPQECSQQHQPRRVRIHSGYG